MMYNGFDRGLASIAHATAIAVALCLAAAAPVMAADQPSTNTPAMTPAPATAYLIRLLARVLPDINVCAVLDVIKTWLHW